MAVVRGVTTWIALFRGINVGGKNVVAMRDLTRVMQSIGAREIKTYIQSGNVVFASDTARGVDLEGEIATTMHTSFGIEAAVQVLSVTDFKAAAARNPFGDVEGKSLHLYFLEAKPSAPDLDALASLQSESERYVLDGNVFYLHAPDGIGRSKLAARAEKLLGVSATARNWNTVSKLLALAG